MKLLWLIYAIMWVGGVISGGVSPQFPLAAPLFLVVAGVLTLHENRDAWKPLCAAAVLGLIFEFIGVHTGLPFGRYSYTSTLAPSVLGVPLAIGFAWLILIAFARSLTGSVLFGAGIMAAIDLVIEPLAAGRLRYWHWIDTGPYFGVPVWNFAGWIGCSAIILALIPSTTRRLPYTGWTVIAFFDVLALRSRLWLPGAIGIGLLMLPVLLRANSARTARG